MSETKKPYSNQHEADCEPVNLDDVATRNLAGFFDVLIQMDLASQNNKKEGSDDGGR